MKHRCLVLLMVSMLLFASSGPVWAHSYDPDDSDHFLRVAAYLVHPFGIALEYGVTRPIHWLVSRPNLCMIFGHQPRPDDVYFEWGCGEKQAKKSCKDDADFKAKMADLEKELQAKKDALEKYKAEMEALKALPVVEHERIEISNAVLFASGKADLTAEGKATLQKVAEYVAGKYPGKRIVVEGHTDSEPIRYSNWKSNWELGAARALSVLHYLTDNQVVEPREISAQTFGEYHPKADGATAADRQMNRRSVIVVVDPLPTQLVAVD